MNLSDGISDCVCNQLWREIFDVRSDGVLYYMLCTYYRPKRNCLNQVLIVRYQPSNPDAVTLFVKYTIPILALLSRYLGGGVGMHVSYCNVLDKY